MFLAQASSSIRTTPLLDWLTQKFKRIGCSQVVEDGVMRGRRAETAGANTIMAADRVYHTLVERQVLSKVHRYSEVAPTLNGTTPTPNSPPEIAQVWDSCVQVQTMPIS